MVFNAPLTKPVTLAETTADAEDHRAVPLHQSLKRCPVTFSNEALQELVVRERV
jgi:hypothetical protein